MNRLWRPTPATGWRQVDRLDRRDAGLLAGKQARVEVAEGRPQLEPGPDADAGPAAGVQRPAARSWRARRPRIAGPRPKKSSIGRLSYFTPKPNVRRPLAIGCDERSTRRALVALDRHHVLGVEAGAVRQGLAPVPAEGEPAAGDDRAGAQRRAFDVLVDRRQHARQPDVDCLDIAADGQDLRDEAGAGRAVTAARAGGAGEWPSAAPAGGCWARAGWPGWRSSRHRAPTRRKSMKRRNSKPRQDLAPNGVP